MRIETYWQDVEIYSVGFYVEKKPGDLLLLNRTLVFEGEVTRKMVETAIENKFKDVKGIKFIELHDEAALKLL
ncbi:hypothetical protein [Carnobacterium maltaromaticum]|uniref:hypothetical protein n=1 Tax=Carnobacterium maltaromaticum TaxID=2751 RepID=UPI0012F97757|nr:hypothetical protein [Carnobacterium maltaromaticum]